MEALNVQVTFCDTQYCSESMFEITGFIVFFFLQAAKKFVSGKKTMASSGHLVNTPFVDEL